VSHFERQQITQPQEPSFHTSNMKFRYSPARFQLCKRWRPFIQHASRPVSVSTFPTNSTAGQRWCVL